MKSFKMLAIAVMVAAAAMAAIGVASASATPEDPFIGLCKANEEVLCKAENLIHVPAGGSLGTLAEAKNPVLVGALTEKCETSKSEFKTSEEDKEVLHGQVTKLTFEGNCTPCKKVTSLGLPYTATLASAGTDYVQTSSGGAELTECTFGVRCEFKGENVTLLGKNTAEGAEFKAEEELLKQTGGNTFFCGSTGKWTANYKVTAVYLYNSSGGLIAEDKGPLWLTLLH